MPFAAPWTDEPSPQFERGFVQYHWSTRALWRPSEWNLELGVARDGRLVGVQGMGARDFAILRTVNTGSWLGRRFQRQGYGTEMRAAVLELAFRGLGAEAAVSGAVVGNEASRRVSEKLGYRVTGMSTVAPRGEPVDHYDLRIERARWRSPVPVDVAGLDPCLPLFGAT
jgi:RimJ/RimL family protein N-acetyltransferase